MAASSSTSMRNRQSSDGIGAVTEELGALKETLTDGVAEARKSGSRVVRAASDAAAQAAGSVKDAAFQARDRLNDAVMERPLTALAIAAGAGALLALVLFRKRS